MYAVTEAERKTVLRCLEKVLQQSFSRMIGTLPVDTFQKVSPTMNTSLNTKQTAHVYELPRHESEHGRKHGVKVLMITQQHFLPPFFFASLYCSPFFLFLSACRSPC